MRAGELRHRIQIERTTNDRNAAGEMSPASVTIVATTQAAIRPASAREVMLTQGVAAQVSHTITIRYVAGIRTSDRVVFDDRRFEIAGILNVDERNVELRLVCFETQGAA